MKKFLIILSYFIILILTNFLVRNEYDKIQNDTSALIIYGEENHQDLLENTKGISSFRRSLSFSSGQDNDIIYTPELVNNSDGSTSYKENHDDEKLNWNYFYDNDNKKIILTYKASTCNMDLAKDEVAILLYEQNYNKEKLPNFLNKEITFKYNEKLIPLKIKQITNLTIYPHICISDELYDELIKTEKSFIYDIECDNYNAYKKIKYNWQDLENNSYYEISNPAVNLTVEISNKISFLGDLIEYIQILNIVSVIIIFVLFVNMIIKSLQRRLNKEIGDTTWEK